LIASGQATVLQVFARLGLAGHPRLAAGSPSVTVTNPATGEVLATVRLDDGHAYQLAAGAAVEAFKRWRTVPAPARGQVIRAIGDAIRAHKADLGMLVSLEVGKIISEGQGEIQEIVDICDYAVGLSRQIPGHVFPSERGQHRMLEQWLPLGPIGVISAFNFPAAVWAWNAMLAAVCGDVVIWKPSLLAPLTALACNTLADRVATELGHPGLFALVIGRDDEVGHAMTADRRVPLISATGSCRMGREVGQVVAKRLGRCLLELGGNNAIIVAPDADLKLATPSIVFGAVGTAGQRCTTTRRLIVHESIVEALCDRLVAAYQQIMPRIGDPTAASTLVGPLVTAAAVDGFTQSIAQAKVQGGKVLVGGERANLSGALAAGHFVQPTIIRAPASNTLPIAHHETFAPILYVFSYRELDEAIAMNNAVDQGLSSSVFTESLRSSERFLNVDGSGSDCGIANVNLGTSGAEIGGAFGGEKDTGGGRESGSDSWKAYMRRQTCTINYSGKLELAQGIKFE